MFNFFELHIPFILNLISLLKPNSYLELGTSIGSTFNLVNKICPKCVGVDINDIRQMKVGTFHKTTTDDFFSFNTDTFDVIFIDANHNFDFVKKDFNNAVKILNKYGIIILHDTDPEEEKLLAEEFCSDSYKMIEYVESLKEYDQITLPISICGLTIIRKKIDKRYKNFIKDEENKG